MLRKLQEKDLEILRQMRNENREWFFHNASISTEEQQHWYDNLPANLSFYVLEEDGRIIGSVSLTEHLEGVEVGNILLDAKYRGRGLMHVAISNLISQAPGKRYYARVLAGNENSLRLFRSSGFKDVYITLEYK